MRRTRAVQGPDGNVHRQDLSDYDSLVRRNPVVDRERAPDQFAPISIWFDPVIASSVAIGDEAIEATVTAAKQSKHHWLRYMDLAFGAQGMPRDMAIYVDPQDRYLAAYMRDEAAKGIPHTASEQQLRNKRFRTYCQLLRFGLPPERRQEFNDKMQIAGQEMELFGQGIQHHVGGVALSETVGDIAAPIVDSDNFVIEKKSGQ